MKITSELSGTGYSVTSDDAGITVRGGTYADINMGFAMLGRLVLTKQLVPFYFLGFLLCSYANVPVLGVALIAIIIGIDKYDLLGLGGAQSQLSVEGDEDDDF